MSTCATKFIPAKTCSTARRSRCSSPRVKNHRRCNINYDPSHFVLMHLDYLAFIDIYHERIKAFHVKDAELNPDGRQGVYSGYQPWISRAGRFRSLGDGQVNFGAIFSKLAALRLRFLGGARMGMLPQASRAGRRRGRAVHRQPHHPRDRKGFRRFHRRQARSLPGETGARAVARRRQSRRSVSWPSRAEATQRPAAASGSAWSAAARARSSALCTASRHEWTINMCSSPARSPATRGARQASGRELGLAPDRIYADYRVMARSEAGRKDGIEAVSIVTPNHLHFPIAKAFMESRHPHHLRQAAGATARRRPRRSQGCRRRRADLRAHAQLHRLSDDPAGPRHGGEGRTRPRSAWYRPNIPRTG